MIVKYKFEHLSFEELETRMRRLGAVWLRNDDLLMLEELLRRMNRMRRNASERL